MTPKAEVKERKMSERIVSESTKNWVDGEVQHADELVSKRFEHIIDVNAKRGYELETWQYQKVAHDAPGGRVIICETIIGVFRRITP